MFELVFGGNISRMVAAGYGELKDGETERKSDENKRSCVGVLNMKDTSWMLTAPLEYCGRSVLRGDFNSRKWWQLSYQGS